MHHPSHLCGYWFLLLVNLCSAQLSKQYAGWQFWEPQKQNKKSKKRKTKLKHQTHNKKRHLSSIKCLFIMSLVNCFSNKFCFSAIWWNLEKINIFVFCFFFFLFFFDKAFCERQLAQINLYLGYTSPLVNVTKTSLYSLFKDVNI